MVINKKRLLSFLFAMLFFTKLASSQEVFNDSKFKIRPFGYEEVNLHQSRMKKQFDEVVKFYLDIPNESLLKGFRERKGLPTNNDSELGGWYSNDVFHVFGQIIGGMSRLYASSGESKLKKKVDYLITEWGKTIDDDGYFYYSESPNAKPYVYEKMVGGLVDAYTFTQNKKALDYLSIITDWAIKNLSRERKYGQTASEWYTLSENLYKAYVITGEKKYLDFANVWEYSDYWNSYLNGGPPVDTIRHHAYSHLNSLSSAAAAYLIKKEDRYKKIIMNSYDYFQDEQCLATGGFGPNEKLATNEKLIETIRKTHNSFETQCGSWAIFKLSKYLIEITGDAKYGDWIEKMLYNGIGASIPMSKDGKVQYYSDYNPREGTKHNHHTGWSCCTGTRPQAVAEYSNLIYFKDNSSLYVNLYMPSEVKWGDLKVTQKTSFPEKNEVNFLINTPVKKRITLSFRKPHWSKLEPVILVNGKEVEFKKENNWLNVRRNWKDKDEIKMIIPMSLYIDSLKDDSYPLAIMYGPVAMALNVTEDYPVFDSVGPDLLSKFSSANNLHFSYEANPNLILKPYYQYKEKEPYILYLDPSVKNIVLEENLVFRGDWKRGRGPYFTNDEKASLSTTFQSSGIKLSYEANNRAGIMFVKIDGKLVDRIDTYSDRKVNSHPWENEINVVYNDLEYSDHTIEIAPAGARNNNSNGKFINFYRFTLLK